MPSLTAASPAPALQPAPAPTVAEIVEPLFETAADSSSLLASRHPVEVAGAVRFIPKFLLLGQRGGDQPIRLALFAGLDAAAPETTSALARLLLQNDLSPTLARDYALFAYPVVHSAGFDEPPVALAEFERRYASDRLDPETQFFKSELRQWAFDGLISLRIDPKATGFHARVRSEVIGREVAQPALDTIRRALPVQTPAVTLRASDRFARLADHAHGKMTAPAGEHPYPFEIEVFAPGSVDPAERITGLFVVVQEIIRQYRKLISHAQHL